ncbi:MAG: EAL domain-containing protein [Telmatospirillum sp.]|nr:EAL domain-containing protein [Telmatospirillum sp.]
MNIPVSGGDGPEVVTQESLLAEAAERIGRIRDGRLAAHLHLSRLRPQNRQEGHVRIALRLLEPVVNAYRGQMFLLSTSDVVFLLKDPSVNDVENTVHKLRALFSKDPLTFSDQGDGRDNFCTWYDIEDADEYQDFLAMTRESAAEARRRLRERTSQKAAPRPIDAKGLSDVLRRLADTDVAGLVRRQSSVVVTKESKAIVLFQEFFVGMSDLQKAVAPETNLLGNRWLFQHLSQTLDRRVLTALEAPDLVHAPKAYSLNLNISTVNSRAFDDFEAAVKGRARIFVELQVLDILADSRGFYAACTRLHDRGHAVVIDGLSEWTLQFMDVGQFEADLYKITWSPDMAEGEHRDALATAVGAIGRDRMLLARCDSEAAINWGLNLGIDRFQGRYVDAMLAAYTMHTCDKSPACTLGQCTARHAVIAGQLRRDCGNNDMLDSSPVMMAPKARNRQGDKS